jgi:hypothetical protein
MRARPLSQRGWLLVLAGALAGCSHYQLGTTGRLAFASLYVAPVANKAMIPQAQAITSTQLRQIFAEDGRLALVDSPADADATLTVVITDYHRDVAAVLENDNGLASKFVLTLGATCTLRDNRTGKAYFDRRPISVQRGAYTDNGVASVPAPTNQLQSEYNTLPVLAQGLADKVAHLVLDVW